MRDGPKFRDSNVAWVTGAHGFIGRHVSRALADIGLTIAGIGHGAWPILGARNAGVTHWLNADITSGNLSTLARLSGFPDVVVHLAGGSSVGSAIAQPHEDFMRTVKSTIELFDWLREQSPETKVVAASTAAVYGVTAEGPISESAPLKPYSPYGFHKSMMEAICDSYGASFGIRSVVVRLFSVYGSGLRKQLLWDLCTKLRENDERVTLGGTGNELRDWVAVSDVAHAISRIASLASVDTPKFNVGTGIATPVSDVAKHVVTAWCGDAAPRTQIEFSGESRRGDPYSLVALPRKLSSVGIDCTSKAFDGITNYVKWFKSVNG
jgi:UDP-glucose 4-epimerase